MITLGVQYGFYRKDLASPQWKRSFIVLLTGKEVKKKRNSSHMSTKTRIRSGINLIVTNLIQVQPENHL